MNSDRIDDSHIEEIHALRALIPLTIGLGIGALLAKIFTPTSANKISDELARIGEGGFVADWSGGDLAGVDTAPIVPERSVKSFLSRIWTR